MMEKSLKDFSKNELLWKEAIALKGLSFYFNTSKNYPLAKSYADSALSLALNMISGMNVKLYTHLSSNLSYSMQDIDHQGQYYATQK
jgi:hypothetical protein